MSERRTLSRTEEKKLRKLFLSRASEDAVRDVWAQENEPKSKWFQSFLGHLVGGLLIPAMALAAFANAFMEPTALITGGYNVTRFLVIVLINILIPFITFCIYIAYQQDKINPLNRQSMVYYKKSNSLSKTWGILFTLALIVLLVINGNIALGIWALIMWGVSRLFMSMIKSIIKDAIKEADESGGPQPAGQRIEVVRA
jgi:hypothetical protein